jgi:hypothetical protein
MTTGKQISLSEASILEIEAVFNKYETRLMIAIEGAPRDAIRNGRDELKTIQQDEQLLTIFSEVVEAQALGGLRSPAFSLAPRVRVLRARRAISTRGFNTTSRSQDQKQMTGSSRL